MQLYAWYRLGKMCVFIFLTAMSLCVIIGLSEYTVKYNGKGVKVEDINFWHLINLFELFVCVNIYLGSQIFWG